MLAILMQILTDLVEHRLYLYFIIVLCLYVLDLKLGSGHDIGK